jgi:hypothetical protein
MALVTRFGDQVVLVREATAADIKTFERRKVDKTDRDRLSDHMIFVARYANEQKKDFTVDLAFLRATNGWAEILDEAAKLQPALRS